MTDVLLTAPVRTVIVKLLLLFSTLTACKNQDKGSSASVMTGSWPSVTANTYRWYAATETHLLVIHVGEIHSVDLHNPVTDL